jgi:uncharacterized RDD family membrane protein YckC
MVVSVTKRNDDGEAAVATRRDPAEQEWRGQRLGLPADGPGSIATPGRRLAALAVDALLSGLVAGLFTAPELPRNWSLLVFVLEYLFFTVAFGQTPGMRLVGLRVIRVDRPVRTDPLRALTRTVLLTLLVPALIWDSDTRCLHDKLSQTAVVRA